MSLKRLGALALNICIASGFKDTSPFFLFSTSEYALYQLPVSTSFANLTRLQLSSPQISSASSLVRTLTAQLDKCPSDNYVIVEQPGVNVADYNSRFAAPHLKQKTSGKDKGIQSSLTVADVIGEIDTDEIVRAIQERCGAVLLKVDASSKPSLIGTPASWLCV